MKPALILIYKASKTAASIGFAQVARTEINLAKYKAKAVAPT